ncbi:MAG: hypothetical protein ABUL67_03160 [Haliangium ochraceum]
MVAVAEPDLLAALRARLARDGLNIVLPLSAPLFDGVCAGVNLPALGTLLDGAAGAVVVGDGGPAFFARFQGQAAGQPPGDDPLDRHTRSSIDNAVSDVLGPTGLNVGSRTMYPFMTEPARSALPFQRLGVAAGLPAAGPLGLQIHPTYGPWWAYRALIVVAAPLVGGPPLAASCPGCPRPCEAACPGGAVAAGGFAVGACGAHRLRDPRCHDSCAARLGCPVGSDHSYPASQAAFHMRSSLAQIRRSPAVT